MRYGLALPTGGECGDPRFLVELAERAEAAGWEGVFLEDYVLYQGDAAAPTCDTWSVLAALAVRTERVLLGTAVTPLTRRRPWNVAREVAAVDQLSGGRAVLGVGLGDVGDHVVGGRELHRASARSASPRRRGAMLDEALEIVAGLWTRRALRLPRRALHRRRGHVPAATGAGAAAADLDRRRLAAPQAGRARAALGRLLPLQREARAACRRRPCADLRARAGDRAWTIAVGGSPRGDDWDAEREHIAALGDAGATGGRSACPRRPRRDARGGRPRPAPRELGEDFVIERSTTPPDPPLSDGVVTLRPWNDGDIATLVALYNGDAAIARSRLGVLNAGS